MGSEEGAFLRGEVGVDGRRTAEPDDPAVQEKSRALEALTRNQAWLGREFLTWLLWRSHTGASIARVEGTDLIVLFVGPVTLRGLSGDANEVKAKGYQSAYADVVREALARGLLIHEARLRILHDEKVYEVTLDAEHLSFRGASIPKLMTEEADDQLLERLFLVDRLVDLVDALWAAFLEVRSEPGWAAREVPALRAWLDDTISE